MKADEKQLTKWQRWQKLSARAARFQGRVIFTLLYFLIVVPTGWARFRSRTSTLGIGEPAWRDHERVSADLDAGRRQY